MGTTPPLDEPPRRGAVRGSASGRGEVTAPKRRKPDRGFEAKTLAALLLAALLIGFAVANSQEVQVDFLVTTANFPLVLVILGAVLLGAGLGAFAHWRSHRHVGK
jgi:uncharacterized integral membrane protein